MTTLVNGIGPVAQSPAPLRRQQLVRLSAEGWARVLEAPWDATARACLHLWASRGLPLVVTRQPPVEDARVAIGLPAPARHGRRRLALAVLPQEVRFVDEFPAAEAITRLLPRTVTTAWCELLASLAAADCKPRVYGSYGWQALTRLSYVHAESDVDLLLPVADSSHADKVARMLATAPWSTPRLDGELLFPDGGAIAWREWLDHRHGRTAQVLVKRLRGVAIETPAADVA